MILRRRAAAPRAAQPPTQLWSCFCRLFRGYRRFISPFSSLSPSLHHHHSEFHVYLSPPAPKSYLTSFFQPGVFMLFFFPSLLHHERPPEAVNALQMSH